MINGINQWAFPAEIPVEKALTCAKDIGFASFEVCVGETGPVALNASEKDITAIRRAAERRGIRLFSVASGMGWQYPLTSPDPALRERGLEAARKTLQITQWLGAEAMLLVPGVVNADISYDAALENALAAIQELANTAEQLRVSVALENVWNKFLLSPVEMRDFIDQCESPYVGAYFDIGNAVAQGYPEQWIRILGPRIRAVHAKDFRAAAADLSGFVTLLEGDVNWPAVAAALSAIGYAGPLTAEFEPYRHSFEAGLRHARASLDAIINLA